MNTTNNFDVDEHEENNPDHYKNHKLPIGTPVFVKYGGVWVKGQVEDDLNREFVMIVVHELDDIRITTKKINLRFHENDTMEL